MVIRPVRKQYPHYPNYSFLQLEEINQTLYNFCPDDFHQWYCLDTRNISKIYPKLLNNKGIIKTSFRDYRYDFIIVTLEINTKTNVWKWTFEVRNILWNGNYIIKEPDPEKIVNLHARTPTLDTDDKTNNANTTLIISGKNLNYMIVCFELANYGDRNIPEQGEDSYMDISFDGTYSYKHQYDIDNVEKCKVINTSTKNPIKGASVTLTPLTEKKNPITGDTSNYLSPQKAVKTGKDGKASITYSKTKTKGTYYARLDAAYDYECTNGDHDHHTATCSTIVTVNKFESYNPNVQLLDEYSMYKGGSKTFEMNINLKTELGATKDYNGEKLTVNVYHTYDTAYNIPLIKPTTSKPITVTDTVYTDEKGNFTFTLDGTSFYGDTSTIKFSVQAQGEYEGFTTEEITISHVWFYVNDWVELEENAPLESQPNAMVLKQGTHKSPQKNNNMGAAPCYINRNFYLLGEKGSGWATLDGNGYSNCIVINDPPNAVVSSSSEDTEIKVVIKGIKFINCNVAITQEKRSLLSLHGCCFINNKNKSYAGVGTCVNQLSKYDRLYVRDSYFYNNYGNTCHCKGATIIDNNLFKIDNWKYPLQPHPYCLEQESMTGIVRNNQFYICPSMYWKDGQKRFHYVDKNKSYAKIAVWVGKNAIVNGKKPSQLKNDGTFNYFDAPYNNRSYTFAAYKQWKGNDRPTVLCSPNSRIHTGCGHASSGWNPRGSKESRCPGASTWAYWDGYQIWYINGRNEAAVRNSGRNLSNPYITIKDKKVVEDPRIIVPSKGGVV